jgi:hypothetical protein
MKHFSAKIFLLLQPIVLSAAPEFHRDIAPIIHENCSSCHRPGQAAPFSLIDYNQVKKRAKQIVEVTGERIMPPWHADHGVVEYANDRSLSSNQIDLLRKWFEAGTPEGDLTHKVPAPVFPDGWELGSPDLEVAMSEPFVVPAQGKDIYRNFVIPLDLQEDQWINAIEYKPGAPQVVHHVLYFLDTSGTARKKDLEDAAPGFSGFGSVVNQFRYLGGWDLGTQASVLPYGLALKAPKGADLIIQVHYSPKGREYQDLSKLAIHFADKPTSRPWTILPVPPMFGILDGIDIPAGEKEYVKKNTFIVPVDLEAFRVNAHAHYLGKRMEMTATFPDGRKEWLLKMSDWNFAWQEDYQFKKPVHLPAGTKIDVLISWDNSATNPHQTNHPPKPVRWGPQSNDEMGTITLSVMLDTQEQKDALHQSVKVFMAAQAVRRAFNGDITTLQHARAGGIQIPDSTAQKLLVLAKGLDFDQDGKLSEIEVNAGAATLAPHMNGIGAIGID